MPYNLADYRSVICTIRFIYILYIVLCLQNHIHEICTINHLQVTPGVRRNVLTRHPVTIQLLSY